MFPSQVSLLLWQHTIIPYDARPASLADPARGAMIAAAGPGLRMRRRLMRILALLAAALMVLAGAGCTTDVGPSPAELKANWEAQNIPPQGYKKDLIAYMRTYLNDPSGVRGATVSQPVLKDFGPGQRFVACVRYSERKGDGKPKEGAGVFVSGKFDRYFDVPRDVQEFCKDAVYAPFPEMETIKR
jgi:hypothetical protein